MCKGRGSLNKVVSGLQRAREELEGCLTRPGTEERSCYCAHGAQTERVLFRPASTRTALPMRRAPISQWLSKSPSPVVGSVSGPILLICSDKRLHDTKSSNGCASVWPAGRAHHESSSGPVSTANALASRRPMLVTPLRGGKTAQIPQG
jgi:hypothetical protein